MKEKTIKFKIGDVEKDVKVHNFFDEFFKAIFAIPKFSESFIKALGIAENSDVKFLKLYKDIDAKFLSGKHIQDFSILAEISNLIAIEAELEKDMVKQKVIVMVEVQKEKSYNLPIRMIIYQGIALGRISSDLTNLKMASSKALTYDEYRESLGKMPILIPVLINLDKADYKFEGKRQGRIFKKANYFDTYKIKSNDFLDNFNQQWIETNIIDWKEEDNLNEALKKISDTFDKYKGKELVKELMDMTTKEKSFITMVEEYYEAKGIERNTKKIAMNMLKANMSIKTIKDITGLSEEDIKNLQEEL